MSGDKITIPNEFSADVTALEKVLPDTVYLWDRTCMTVEYTVNKWAELARSCGDSYGMIEEYINDLGHRARLESIIDLLTEGPFAWWFIGVVDELDDVFRSNTDWDDDHLGWWGIRPWWGSKASTERRAAPADSSEWT